MDWLPRAMNILNDELPSIDVIISSDYSPRLAKALMRGELDAAFLRPELEMPDLEYKVITRESLFVIMPSDHRLAARKAVAIAELANETFIGMSKTAPTLQVIIDEYLKLAGLNLHADHEVDNLGMAISIVASTRGVALIPAYARNFLPGSVISRPLEGEAPTIDLVIGYNRTNTSPILELFLSRVDQLKKAVRRSH
jgi:LysR family hca operon transcriptional activator